MQLLITGTTGYIGHRLAMAAVQQGFSVHALVRNPQAPTRPQHPDIRFFQGDITDPEAVARAMAGCRQVIHAAALAKFRSSDRSGFYRVNVGGTQTILEAAGKAGVEKLVFTSTCAVLGPSYGRPVKETDLRTRPFDNDYEISKYCAEQLVAEYVQQGVPAVTVALPRVYGPGPDTEANPVTKLIRQAVSRGFAFMPATSRGIGSYTFIDDVVRGHLLALERGRVGEQYILGGENASYEHFFQTIQIVSGQHLRLIRMPRLLLLPWSALFAGVSWLTGADTQISPATVNRLFRSYAMSSDKAIGELGYTITPLQTGIEKTIQSFKTGLYE